MTAPKLRGAILISGRGSNMTALLQQAQHDPAFPVDFTVVISDKVEAPGLSAAAQAGLKAHALTGCRDGRARTVWEAELNALLDAEAIDLVCLAGFMRLLSPDFVDAWEGRILNIHPSLLPAYPGLDAQAQALDDGATEAGCTVHVVTAEMDAGPVLGQAKVPVFPADSVDELSARILVEEHRLYPQCVAQYARGSIASKEQAHAG